MTQSSDSKRKYTSKVVGALNNFIHTIKNNYTVFNFLNTSEFVNKLFIIKVFLFDIELSSPFSW